MSVLHAMDGGEISLAIDVDQGARIASLEFRGIECVLPFRGEVLTWGWYSMGPWAGRVRDGLFVGCCLLFVVCCALFVGIGRAHV